MNFSPIAIHPYQSALSLDDYFQLQMLLRHEQAERERQRRKEAAMLREQERIQHAMNNLTSLLHNYRRERYRQIDRIQQLRQKHEAAAALLARQEEQERFRGYLADAIEKKRLETVQQQYKRDQLAKRKREEAEKRLREQHQAQEEKQQQQEQENNQFQEYRAKQLAELVKLIFQHPSQGSASESQHLSCKEREEWDDLMCSSASNHNQEQQDAVDEIMAEAVEAVEATEEAESDTHQLDLSSDSNDEDCLSEASSSSKSSSLPLDNHVMTVKGLLDELASTEPAVLQDDVRHESSNNEQGSGVALSDEINSAKEAKLEILHDIQAQLDAIEQRYSDVVDRQLRFQKPLNTLVVTASTDSNRAFLGYEDAVMQVLLKLDAIESSGDDDIRTKRKNIVRQAEQALERLDAHKQAEWEKSRRAERRQAKKMKRRQERRSQCIPVY